MGRRGRGRRPLIAKGCGDRRDDDQEGGDTAPAIYPCWVGGGSRLQSRQRGVAGTYVVFDTPAICGGSSIESMRLLLVEDEPYMAEAIRDGLRLEAIAADIAPDGTIALELLGVNAYDIAVLDQTSPGLR